MTEYNNISFNRSQTLTLKDVRDGLLAAYDQVFSRQKIVITGTVTQSGDYFHMTNEDGDKLKLYFADSFHLQSRNLPLDGDTVTVMGYLNAEAEKYSPALLKEGRLGFWFNVRQLLAVERCNESKRYLLEKACAHKERKTPREDLYHTIYGGEKPRIHVLCSSTAKEDILQGLGDCIANYDITFEIAPLSNKTDAPILAQKVREADKAGHHVAAVSRGGNEAYDIFYEEEVYTSIIGMRTATLAGLGHSTLDEPLLMMFDEVLKTPNEFGHYLKEIVIDCNSKKETERQNAEQKAKKKRRRKIAAIAALILLAISIFIWYIIHK